MVMPSANQDGHIDDVATLCTTLSGVEIPSGVDLPADIQSHLDFIRIEDEGHEELKRHLIATRFELQELRTQAETKSQDLTENQLAHILRGKAEDVKLLQISQAIEGKIAMLKYREKGLVDEIERSNIGRANSRRELSDSFNIYTRGEIAKAKDKIRVAVNRLLEEIAVPLATGRVLGDTSIAAMQRYMQLTSLGTGRDLAQPVGHLAWRQNPAMVAVTEQYEQVIQAVNAVVRERL
jgi:hypothetical protein